MAAVFSLQEIITQVNDVPLSDWSGGSGFHVSFHLRSLEYRARPTSIGLIKDYETKDGKAIHTYWFSFALAFTGSRRFFEEYTFPEGMGRAVSSSPEMVYGPIAKLYHAVDMRLRHRPVAFKSISIGNIKVGMLRPDDDH